MTTRIYDLPTRILHWLFATSFLTALTIANLVNDESTNFAYHMLAGLVMSFVVLCRIAWGIIGSTHAKFSDFSLNPQALLLYIKGILTGNGQLWTGHNPASSWAATAMMLLALGLSLTGFLMANDSSTRESLEDIHEILADAFIVVVILHVSGLIVHTIRHKDGLGKSMLTGHKTGLQASIASVPSHPIVAMIVLVLTLSFGECLRQNYDTESGSLYLFGTTLQLAENEVEYEENEHD